MLLLILLSACGSGDLPLDQVDPNAAPLQPTWSQVFPIFQRECIPCHATDDPPGGTRPNLETCEAIIANLADIATDIFVLNKMPPGAWPRLTEVERLTIERWIANGATAPCN
ncbi:MAG: hypothetical protein V3V49_00465 [Candidatus Krumholzibacteria bacterium]